jgi:hypothetical protein
MAKRGEKQTIGWDGRKLPNFEAAVRATRFAAMVAALTCERAGAQPPVAAKGTRSGASLQSRRAPW